MSTAFIAKRIGALLVASSAAGLCLPAQAASHALIMWIGNYSRPSANLPGIHVDGENARKIAVSMGVPEQNIVVQSNEQLTTEGIGAAIQALSNRIQQGDKVFIYYSGHGSQIQGAGGSKCTEGMVAHDLDLYRDSSIEADLDRLTGKASQLIFMNDSCFSGGQATKGTRSQDKLLGALGAVPKVYLGQLKSGSVSDPAYECGEPVNKVARSLEVRSRRKGANYLYIAASADNEIAFATPRGSSATLAWMSCLSGQSDRDRSGLLTGREIQSCAQAAVQRMGFTQTISLLGNPELPMSLVDSAPAASPVAQVSGRHTLENIRASASPGIQVTLNVPKPSIKIGADYLDFSVSTSSPGYLYILHIGTSGDNFIQLFPNEKDSNNYVPAGTHRFPRETWMIGSRGPAGTGYLMAYISDTPKDLASAMNKPGVFRSASTNTRSSKDLYVAAVGAAPGAGGRYGASQVVSVVEIQ